MKNKVDYNCERCGHIAFKIKNWKTRTWEIVKSFFVVIFIVNFTIGSMGIYNFLQGNVLESPDKILSLGQMYSFVINIKSNFQFGERADKLDDIANEIIIDCKTEKCKAKALFDYLSEFEYRVENATDLDPIKTWKSRKGDCDQMSYLLLLLLKTQEISSMIDCNHNHCWTMIYIEEKEIVADITQYRWDEYSE